MTVTQKITPALGHEIVEDVAVAATCTTTGLEAGSHCTRCNDMTVEQAVIPALGHDMVVDVATEATCTTDGMTAGAHCSRCDDATEEPTVIPALGHDIIIDAAVEATCTTAGLTAGQHCTRCDAETIAQTEIPALDHEIVVIDAVDATCTTTGLTEGQYCTRCDDMTIEQAVVDALDHNMVVVPGVDATCTEAGMTEGRYCTRCDDMTIAQTEIAALGHKYPCEGDKICINCNEPGEGETEGHSFANYTSNNDATCTKDGTMTGVCANCGETSTIPDVGSMLAHSFTNYVSNEDATCTENGTETAKCDNCDATDKREDEDSALSHDWVDATCTAPQTCDRCGATEGTALEHSYDDVVEDVASTCLTLGHITKKCTCGATKTTDYTELDATKHEEIKDIKANEPTCLEDGNDAGSFCVCGTIIVTPKTIPALGHSFTTYEASAAATCTENAKETATCDRCEETDTRDIPDTASGHDWAAATCTAPETCTVCGETQGEALGHKEVTRNENVINETCNTDGSYDLVTYCIVCGEVFSTEAITVPATGEHNFEEEVENVASTCSTLGHITMKCACGETETTYSDEYNEDNHETEVVIDAKDPTCTEAGRTAGKYCSSCNKVFELQETINALGHSFKNYVSNEDATCTENGTETATCDRCTETDTREEADSALGHAWAAATCAAPETCTVCGATQGEKLEHSFTNFVSNNDATCTEDGTKTAVCDNGCNSKSTVTDTGSALGHDIVIDEAVPATCIATGLTEGQHCSRCDDATIPQETVELADHNLKDVEGTKTCTVCGETTKWGDVKVVITADKATAEPSDDITFTVELSPVQSVTVVEFTLDVPAGLTLKSAELESGLEEKFGATVCEFDEENNKVTITCNETAYTSTEMTAILTVECTVNKGFTGSLALNVTEVCLADGEEILEVETDINDATVAVSCSHSKYVNEVAVKYLKSSATCTAAAVYYKSCELCFEASTDTFEDGDALGHNIVKDEAVAPTCENTGLKEGSHCTRCVDKTVEQEVVPALGHKYTNYVSNDDATCTEDGTKTAVCDNGCNSKSTVTDAGTAGHKWVAATCTAPKTCSVCNTTEGNALGHDEVVDAEVAPSCTTTGLTEGKHCSRCNTVLVAQGTVPALDHDWQQMAPVLPECCTRCGLSRNATVELIITADKETAKVGDTITYTVSLGPVYMLDAVEFKLVIPEGLKFKSGALVDGVQDTLKAAACNFNADKLKVAIAGCLDFETLTAYTSVENTPILTFTCTVEKGADGDIIMGVDTENWYFEDFFQPISAVLVNEGSKVNIPCTHSDVTVHEAVASSCTTPGHAEYTTCNKCGIIVDGSDEALELDPDNHVDVTVYEAVHGTCENPGHAEYTECNECGILVSGSKDAVTNDPHGNSQVEAEEYIKTPGTCTTATVYYKSCELCGVANITTFTADDISGHDMVAVTGTPATCTEAGITDGEQCSRCGETTQTVIPATGHAWAAATCETAKTCVNCGLTDGEALGHTWTDATCTAPMTCSVCNKTEGEALGHKWTDATCTTAKTCTVCNETEGEALGHKPTEATCTNDSVCTVCNEVISAANGHSFAAATCTAPATCTVCGATQGEALGHNMVKDEAVDPTCTTVGYTEGAHCSRCDYEVAQKEIAALGHEIVALDAVAPTCTTAGLTAGEKCSRCDYAVAQEEIAALGHEIIKLAGKDATCTEAGLTEGEKCSRCDHAVAQKEIAALGHEIEMLGAVDATCTTSGLTEGAKCSRCNAVLAEQVVISALGHDMITDEAVEPTCTQTGLTEGAHCSRCDVKAEQQVIDARGHNFSAATCTEAKTCKVCGVTEGKALGHNATEATCTEASVCSVCNAVVSEANGHRFADATCTSPATCTACGATEGDALGHKWIDASYDAPKTCERCGAVEGNVLPTYKVSGAVTSFGSSTDEITVVLKDSEGNVVHTATTIGNNATFFISDVKSGTYTMLVSKNGHTTREYTVVVADADATQNAEIALTGDLNFDGKVNIVDINMMYDHILGEILITDEYAIKCADMNGDGNVNVSDNNLLYNKVLGE